MSTGSKLGIAMIASAVVLLIATVTTVSIQSREAQNRYTEAIDSGYSVTYDGENFAEMPYAELRDHFNLNYLRSEKKIVLSPRSRNRSFPVIIP